MKKELLVASAVLVPFAVLVALAWHFTGTEGSRPDPQRHGGGGLQTSPERILAPGTRPPQPAPMPVGSRAPAPAQPAVAAAPERDAGATTSPPGDGLSDEVEPRLEAPLKAVRAEVRRCFGDEAPRRREPATVRIAFRPLPDGGFADVAVQSDSWQDPYVDACLADVFSEVGFVPSGREDFTRVVHEYRFTPKNAAATDR